MAKSEELVINIELESIFPIILSLQMLMALLQLLDAINYNFYAMVHRSWVLVQFSLGTSFVVPLFILLLFWSIWMILERSPMVAIPIGLLIILFLFTNINLSISLSSLFAVAIGFWLDKKRDRFLFSFFLLLCLFLSFSLLHWIIFMPLRLNSPFEFMSKTMLVIFYMLTILSPYVGLTIILTSIWKIARKPFTRTQRTHKPRVTRSRNLSPKIGAFLIFSASLSVFAAIYPYFPSINPKGVDVGIDIQNYVKATELVGDNFSQAFSVMGGTRPLIFLVLLGFQKLIHTDLLTAVRFFPILLNPLLVLASFYLSLEIWNDGWTAGWTAFFLGTGLTIMVGLFSYFLTNMLGLTFAFFSLGLLFRSFRKNCIPSLVISILFGILLIFTHPWTFNQFYLASVITTLMIIYRKIRKKENFRRVIFALSYILCLGSAELVKSIVLKSPGSAAASQTVIEGITTFPNLWQSLETGIRFSYGGFMTNLLLLGLALIGIVYNENWDIPNSFFKTYMFFTSIIFIFADETVKSRLFYNIPISFFAAFGFLLLFREKFSDNLKLVFTSFTILYMSTSLFQGLALLT